jgi:hypothetical protein
MTTEDAKPAAAPAVTVTPVTKIVPTSTVGGAIPVVEVKTEAAPAAAEPTAEETATATEAAAAEEAKKKPRGVSKYLATVKEREEKVAERERLLAEKEQNATKEVVVTTEDMKLRPSEFLKKHGMTFEEFAKAVINEGNEPSADDRVAKVEEKLSKIEQDKLDKEKADAEAKEKGEQDYINKVTSDYKAALKVEIAAKPDDYELIIANDAHDLVYEVVEAFWFKNQKILDLHEACTQVENYLLEKAKKIMSVKKLAAKEEGKKPEASGIRTLTNGVGSHSVPSAGIPAGLSREERLKLASEKLRYN